MRVSMASWTHSALFPVSETCSISTVVNVVAAKYSGARLIRILRSRYFFSFYRLSGAATHLTTMKLYSVQCGNMRA